MIKEIMKETQSVGLPTETLSIKENGYAVIDWRIPTETDVEYSLALSPVEENGYITAEIGVDSTLIEKRYFHKDNLHWILKQFKNNSYEYDFDKINDLVMLNVGDFVDDGEFCGIPVEYDHSETTHTRRVFSVGGFRFEVTHLQYMDHLQLKAYGGRTNPDFDVTVTDARWSSVHDLIDAFLRCRGVK